MDAHYYKSFDMFAKKTNKQYEYNKVFKRYLPSVVQRIASSFGNERSQFNILSVGSGSGEVDIKIVDIIQQELKNQQGTRMNILNRAIEPNKCLRKGYKKNVGKLGKKKMSSCTYEIKPQTFQEYQESQDVSMSFDIVHFIHSLYYLDLEQAILYCAETQLGEKGCLVFMLNDDDNVCSKVLAKQDELAGKTMNLSEVNSPLRLTEQLMKIAEKYGWKFEIHSAVLYIDVTEVFNDHSVEGSLLLDFFTNTENYRENVPEHFLQETLTLIQQESFVKGGKRYGEIHESLAILYK